ncbi:MAG: hypothetical protein U0359_21865 [Byssovorax sp.]
MRGALFFLVGSLALGAGGLAAGCTDDAAFDWGRNCTPEEVAMYGCAYCPASCLPPIIGPGDAGTGDASIPCEGQCVPRRPVDWNEPLLLWTGPGPDVPACPPQAAGESGYDWYGDLQAPPLTCGSCTCTASAGSCTLPEDFTVSSATCAGPQSGAEFTFFDAPAGWDGSCTSMDGIMGGKICDGLSCVQSITIAPLQVTEGGCMKVDPPPPEPVAPTWGKRAVVCPGTTWGKCGGSAEECMPASAPGFERCVSRAGVWACPEISHYSERHVLYTGFSDTRGCAPCSCGEPVGSSCFSSISIFTDDACGVPIPFTVPIDALGPKCHDLPAGTALGSKSAGPITYAPGICQPGGGGPIGAAEPLDPTTFCCLPEP